MGRASWGGQVDYSSVFASLYDSAQTRPTTIHVQGGFTSSVSAQSSAAETRAEEEAEDTDILSQWQAGVPGVDDTALLAHLRSRVQTTKDPKRKANYEKSLRYYENAISDAQAKTAYDETGDIDALIAHYADRLKGVEPDSQEGRDLQEAINNARDTRITKNIDSGARRVQEQIEIGKATNDDLLKFYKDSLKEMRPGSQNREQLLTAISNLESTMRGEAANAEKAKIAYEFDAGKISGTAASDRFKKLAEQFKTSDPQTYYSLLDTALGYAKYGGRSGTSGGSGGGGGGSGSGGGSTTAVPSATLIERLKDRDTRYSEIINKWLDAGGKIGARVFDPAHPDQPMLMSEGNIRALTDQWLGTKDALALALQNRTYKNGRPNPDLDGAKKALGDKVEIITKVSVPLATIPFERGVAVATDAILKQIDAASGSGAIDPNDVLAIAQRGAAQLRAMAEKSTTISSGARIVDGGRRAGAEVRAPKGAWDPSSPDSEAVAKALALATFLEQGGAVATGTGLSSAMAQDALTSNLPDYIGSGTYGELGKILASSRAASEALAAGTATYVMTTDGPGVVPLVNGVPDMSGVAGWSDDGSSVFVPMVFEVKGQHVQGFVEATKEPLPKTDGTSAFMWMSATKLPKDATGLAADVPEGIIDSATLAQLQKSDGWQDLVEQGIVQRAPYTGPASLYHYVTGAYSDGGKTYASREGWVDSTTGENYTVLPVDTTYGNSDGSVSFVDGRAQSTWREGVSRPLAAVVSDPRRLQAEINEGRFEVPTAVRQTDGTLAPAAGWENRYVPPEDVAPYLTDATDAVFERVATFLSEKEWKKRKAQIFRAGQVEAQQRSRQYGEPVEPIDQVADVADRFGIHLFNTPTQTSVGPAPKEPVTQPTKPYYAGKTTVGTLRLPPAPEPEEEEPSSFLTAISEGINSALDIAAPTLSLPGTAKKKAGTMVTKPAAPKVTTTVKTTTTTKKKTAASKASDAGVAPASTKNKKFVAF